MSSLVVAGAGRGKPQARRRFRLAAGVLASLALAACSDGDGRGFIWRAPPKPTSAVFVRPAPEQAARSLPESRCGPSAATPPAAANAETLLSRIWAPFGRDEIGWGAYAPRIGREIGSGCAPDTPGFAEALRRWQSRQGVPATGVLDEAGFMAMKTAWQLERPFVRLSAQRLCPQPPAEAALATALPEESYGGKVIQLRATALAAYRRMVEAAKREEPRIRLDARNLTIFSGFRSPATDAARCLTEQNCDGIVRAACSAHRTGLAFDVFVGAAPGYSPDSSADPNRFYMSQTATYAWLTTNAGRFGFVNYPFEPWHWEWTGDDLGPAVPFDPAPLTPASAVPASPARSAGPSPR